MNEEVVTNVLVIKAAGCYVTVELGNSRHIAPAGSRALLYLVRSIVIFVEHFFVAFRHFRAVSDLLGQTTEYERCSCSIKNAPVRVIHFIHIFCCEEIFDIV